MILPILVYYYFFIENILRSTYVVLYLQIQLQYLFLEF